MLSKVILTGYCTLASVVAAHVLAAGKVVALVTLSGRRAHTGAHEQSLIMIWLLSVGENPSTHTLFVLNGRVAAVSTSAAVCAVEQTAANTMEQLREQRAMVRRDECRAPECRSQRLMVREYIRKLLMT